MPWSRRALVSAMRHPKRMKSSPETPRTPRSAGMFSSLPQGYIFLILQAQLSYPGAAQSLFWTGHGGSLYREGRLGLRKLRKDVLSHQQGTGQLRSSLLHVGTVRTVLSGAADRRRACTVEVDLSELSKKNHPSGRFSL